MYKFVIGKNRQNEGGNKMKKFEVGERVQVIYENELKTGAITNLYILDALVSFDSGGQKEGCIPFANIAKLEQPEPVVVPSKIFDFIKSYDTGKDSLIVFEDILGDYINDEGISSTYISEWLDENLFELADALRNGYVVEEEKKYYVHVVPGEEGYLNLRTNRDGSIYYGLAGSSEVEGFQTKFTEEEIKAIDEKLWQFAVPVEEVEAE